MILENFNGYTILNIGKVISTRGRKEPTEIIGRVSDKGYRQIGMTDNNGKKRRMYLHRLVAMCHIPNPENKPEVNHKDLNKLNNHHSNLEWCTRQENIDHYMENRVGAPKRDYTYKLRNAPRKRKLNVIKRKDSNKFVVKSKTKERNIYRSFDNFDEAQTFANSLN